MRILYLSISYVPSRRASSVHVMKMCAAIARANHEVTLTTKDSPSRQENGVGDDFAFYGTDPIFSLQKLPRPPWRGGGLVYLRHLRQLLSSISPQPDLVYSRDLAGAIIASRLPVPIVFEAHAPPSGALSRLLHRRLLYSPRLRRLVVISEALRKLFQQSGVLPPDLDVVVAHDAADPLPPSTTDQEALPPSLSVSGVTHVGYVGHLYPGRGVEVIAGLAKTMPDHYFHIVGGSREDLALWRSRHVYSNLHFHGFVAPGRLPAFYRALEVLLAPYQARVLIASGETDTSSWMSPMKLFEYMAAGAPIVSSDLPVLQEVLRHRENALLVPPDDIGAWREALEKLASEPDTARDLAQTARRDFLDRHTWDARATSVLEGL